MYVSLHGDPARAYPYAIGFADETGAAPAWVRTSICRCRSGSTTRATSWRSTNAGDAIEAFGATLLVVSLGLDTFIDDPICDLALTADGFEASGRRVSGLGLPTVVLQEGGYAVADLGENARRWLVGAGA